MSKDRQKARTAKQAARQAEIAEAAAQRAKQAKRQVLLKRVKPTVPKRKRRYGALPGVVIYRMIAIFLGVQVVAWYFVSGVGARFSVAVLTAAVLLVLVNTRRSTTR